MCVCVCVCKKNCRRSKERKNYFKMSRSTKRFEFFQRFFFIYSFRSYIRVCFQFVAFVREHIQHKALLMEYQPKRKNNKK